MYAVIRGTKTFTLKPPCCVHHMHLDSYDTLQEHMDLDSLSFTTAPVAGAERTRWSPIDLRVQRDASEEPCNQPRPDAVATGGCSVSGHDPEDDDSFRTHCPFNAAFAASSESPGNAPPSPASKPQETRFGGGCPRFHEKPRPLQVTLHAGDVLYLPAMWYHYVEQDEGSEDAAIAVNWWFDMRFDERYAQHQLLDRLSRHV